MPQDLSTAAVAGRATAPPASPWRAEVWATFALAWPMVLTQLAQIAIQTTDVIMMGWLGPQALAAGQLGSSLYMPLWLCGLGVVVAVAPLAAQAVGARQFRAVRRIVRQGFWVAATVSLPAGLVLWQAETILLVFGQAEANAALSGAYLRWMILGFTPSLWIIVLRCFAGALSRPRPVLVVTVAGIGLNALCNYALMFGKFGFPAFGLVGAGMASALVFWAMFLVLLGYMLWDRKFRRYAIVARFWLPDWRRYREIFRLGLPIGAAVVAESSMFSAAGILMGLISTEALAAHAIALQCAAVAFMVPLGLSQATTIRVGLAAGARDPAGIGRAGWVALGLALLLTALGATLFLTAPRLLVDFYLDLEAPENARVVSLALSYLLIAALFQVFDGTQVVAQGALRGLKDTRAPMLVAVIGYWGIGFTGSVLLGFVFDVGGVGIWTGLALGLAVVAFLLVWRFHRRERYALAPVAP